MFVKYPTFFLIFSAIFALAATSANAQETTTQHRYTPAKPIKRNPPVYPLLEARRSYEGWVDLHFKVTQKGEVTDIQMTGHSGVEGFVRPAIEAASTYVYEPATLNGEPIESIQDIRILFMLDKTPRGANYPFVRAFKRFRAAIKREQMDEATQYINELRELKSNNLYEHAFLNLAEYYYGLLTDASPSFLISKLEGATRRVDWRPYIGNEAWVDAMRAKFVLQTNIADYGAALKTFEKIPDDKRYTELRAQLNPIVEQINELKTNEKHFATQIKTSNSGLCGVRLIKPVFTITDLKGEIENISLSCDSGIYGLAFEQNVEYQIPKSYGDCYVRVKSSPRASFSLVQFPVQQSQ